MMRPFDGGLYLKLPSLEYALRAYARVLSISRVSVEEMYLLDVMCLRVLSR